jgi:hypothetical protein
MAALLKRIWRTQYLQVPGRGFHGAAFIGRQPGSFDSFDNQWVDWNVLNDLLFLILSKVAIAAQGQIDTRILLFLNTFDAILLYLLKNPKSQAGFRSGQIFTCPQIIGRCCLCCRD